MKNEIVLSSEVPYDRGTIANMFPTTFHDWILDVEVSVKGERGGTGGSIWLSFGEGLNHELFDDSFYGFVVYIDNSMSVDNSSIVNLLYKQRDEQWQKLESNTKLKLRNQPSPVRIRLNKIGNYIEVLSEGAQLLKTEIPNMLDYGYFTVTAMSGYPGDRCDLYGIRVAALSQEDREIDEEKLMKQNQKLMYQSERLRNKKKEERRKSMAVSHRHLEQAKGNNHGLFSSDDTDLRDAFLIIKEAQKRGDEFVTVNDLMNFINSYVRVSSAKAMVKVQIAMDEFNEIHSQLSDLWSNLKSGLLELRIETKNVMDEVKNSSLKTASLLKLNIKKKQTIKRMDEVDTTEGNAQLVVAKSLRILMGLEFVFYLIFFFYQRRRTSGFKKLD